MTNIPTPENLDRATSATTLSTKVKLSELKLQPERYSHRKPEDLDAAQLEDLKKSLRLEGLQTPIEYYVDAEGNKIVTKGHRRVTALRQLAGDNLANFSFHMNVEAIEVSNATAHDLLVRSIADNCQRLDLDQNERMRAAKLLWDERVPKERAAYALGISPKQYERDLRVVRNSRMFAHIEAEHIKASTAAKLLETAEQKKSVTELLDQFDAWIEAKQREIEIDNRRSLAANGKPLPDAKLKVASYLTPAIVSAWVEAIKQGQPLRDDTEPGFFASFDSKNATLKIPAANFDLREADLGSLAKLGSRLSNVTKQIAHYLRQRKHELEQGRAKSAEDALYDTAYLRDCGLDSLADELEEEQRSLDDDTDVTASPDDVTERPDRDLTAEIDLDEPSDEEGR